MQKKLRMSSILIEDTYEKNQIHVTENPVAHDPSLGQLE